MFHIEINLKTILDKISSETAGKEIFFFVIKLEPIECISIRFQNRGTLAKGES